MAIKATTGAPTSRWQRATFPPSCRTLGSVQRGPTPPPGGRARNAVSTFASSPGGGSTPRAVHTPPARGTDGRCCGARGTLVAPEARAPQGDPWPTETDPDRSAFGLMNQQPVRPSRVRRRRVIARRGPAPLVVFERPRQAGDPRRLGQQSPGMRRKPRAKASARLAHPLPAWNEEPPPSGQVVRPRRERRKQGAGRGARGCPGTGS